MEVLMTKTFEWIEEMRQGAEAREAENKESRRKWDEEQAFLTKHAGTWWNGFVSDVLAACDQVNGSLPKERQVSVTRHTDKVNLASGGNVIQLTFGEHQAALVREAIYQHQEQVPAQFNLGVGHTDDGGMRVGIRTLEVPSKILADDEAMQGIVGQFFVEVFG
jgi:hypothetical protein